ncbi:programmed cell death protein 2 [Syncephalis pseudoplumigaleata]|uniref:Programmed cell death protein 2 n=1 Tax=Syncephalis pseudoplumigaleata TaxID=1712513 RepID=A0A4P9Z652_9FUNG|nr:programmed cell death protein 2 [Syncephalis pseudoplumigaleata]|eukprot:RKP28117.1 programmed cell death protein 2 [Syncephalis pseudoplumigaleata]
MDNAQEKQQQQPNATRRSSVSSEDSVSVDGAVTGEFTDRSGDDAAAVVQLGFAEQVEEDERDEAFGHEAFPSKIGGRPTWLNPTKPLPAERVLCGVCKDPMTFLLQLYAPEDQPAEAFHRTIYMYCCPKGACHQASWRDCFRVLRSQLPRDNPDDEEEEEEDDAPIWQLSCTPGVVCAVCGLHGSKQCSRCRGVFYCSRTHQILDWTVGGHREACGKASILPEMAASMAARRDRCLFAEREIVSEPEGEGEQAVRTDALEIPHRMAETYAKQDKEALEEEYEDTEVHVDDAFLAFQQRIARYPDQVIRYARVDYTKQPSRPLWVSDLGLPSMAEDITPCSYCGAERTFEFQVLPQMLNFLRIDHAATDALDWGTLVVYTCTRNCHVPDESYMDELVWRQEFSRDGLQDRIAPSPAAAS